MKYLLAAFIYLSASLAAHDDIEQLLHKLDQVKPSVHEKIVSRSEYDKRIDEVVCSLAKSLKHHDSIYAFIIEATGSLYKKFTVTDIGDDLFHGLMGSDVYIVRTKRGAPIGVLKVYPHDFRQFAEEVWAMTHLQKIHCQTLRPPTLYGIGATTLNQRQVLLTFQEYATGESLDQMIRKYLETRENLSNLCQACFLLGKALGELHQAKPGPKGPMHPIFEDSAQYFYQSGIKLLKDHPEYRVDIQKLSESYQKLLKKVSAIPHHRRYTHFDVHGGNYKVNMDDYQVWMLDLEPAAYSIASGGEPIGSAALDYVQAVEYLKSYKFQGLKKRDYKQLQRAFKKGYRSTFKIPTREERKFYALVDALIYLDFYYTRIDGFNESNRKLLKEIVNDRMKRLNKIIDPQ